VIYRPTLAYRPAPLLSNDLLPSELFETLADARVAAHAAEFAPKECHCAKP